MINLRPEELDRLKLFFSELNPQKPSAFPKRTLTMEEKIFTLNILRENFPNLFSGLTEEQLKDNNFLLKHLSNPYNRHKIRDTLRRELSKLSVSQQNELAEILEEESVGTERIAVQPTGEAPQADQPIPPTSGSMPGGLPTMPAVPRFSVPRFAKTQTETEPAIGPATAKIDRLAAQEAAKTQAQNISEPINQPIPPQTTNLPQALSTNTPSTASVSTKSTETKQIEPMTTSPTAKRLNLPAFRSSISSGFKNAQNFIASKANIPTRNLLRGIGKNVKGMFQGLGSGAAQTGSRALGGLTNMANSGRIGGIGSNSIFGRLGRIGKGGGNIGKMSTTGKTKSRTGLNVALGLIGFIIIVGGISAISQTPQPGEASPISGGGYTGAGCPDTSTNTNAASCHYLNPSINLFDTAISQSAVDSYISKYSSVFTGAKTGDLAEFAKRVNYIVSNSQLSGLNPAIFLGYWKTESNFSTLGTRDMGCLGNDFYEQVNCALGINEFSNPAMNPVANCARSGDANNIACQSLKSIRETTKKDSAHPINYPIATFDDFAESYGSVADDPNNCTHTYNMLIETTKELGACRSITVIGGGAGGVAPALATDCPIPNGTITCGSLATPVQTAGGLCGHCGVGYEKFMFNCTPEKESLGNKYALDIATTTSQPVLLPKINGHIIKWNHLSDIRGGSGYIQTYSGIDTETQQSYLIQFQHTEAYSGNRGEHLSGERSANACSNCGEGHIHVQLRDPASLNWLDAAQYFCRK